MVALSSRLRSVEGGRIMFWCPGCKEPHAVAVGAGQGPRWSWNGNADLPTFAPSVLVREVRSPSGDVMTDEEEAEYDAIFAAGGREAVFASRFGTVCHFFVTDGRIQFLTDCTHPLAGQTVELPPFSGEEP